MNENASIRRLLLVAGLLHRTISIPVGLAAGLATIGRLPPDPFLWIASTAGCCNLFAAVAVITGMLDNRARSQISIIADVTVMLGLNAVAASIIPHGHYLDPSFDLLHLYTLGTVVVWTSLRGTPAGFCIVGTVAALQVVLVGFTGSAITVSGALLIIGRLAWLLAAIIVTRIIYKFASNGIGKGVREGERLGRAVEHSNACRNIHDTVLQTFGQIVRRSTMGAKADERLHEIGDLARSQADALETILHEDGLIEMRSLPSRLQVLINDHQRKGMSVELKLSDVPTGLPIAAANALVGAVGEALTNAAKHAYATHVHVACRVRQNALEILVSDNGRGFIIHDLGAGFGIKNSIVRRMREVGGLASLTSTPDAGTRVQLSLPLTSPQAWIGNVVRQDIEIAISPTESASPGALVAKAMNWFAVPALWYRVCISPIQVIFALSSLEANLSRTVAVAMLFILAGDIFLAVGATRGRLLGFLSSMQFMLLDATVAAGLNIWEAIELPSGAAISPERQVFWTYALGVVVLWTGLRGIRAGLFLVASGALVQVTMLRLNGLSMTPTVALPPLVAQVGLLAMALVVVWAITDLARHGAEAAVVEGLRLGRSDAKTDGLKNIEATMLDALREISETAKRGGASPDDGLRAVRGTALGAVDFIRASISATAIRDGQKLLGELRRIKDEFQHQGVRVELVTSEFTVDPSLEGVNALAEASRAALANAVRYSGEMHVVVRVSNTPDGVEIVIRDQGCGFDQWKDNCADGAGGSMRAHMLAVGGGADIWSAPGQGTRVRLLAP